MNDKRTPILTINDVEADDEEEEKDNKEFHQSRKSLGSFSSVRSMRSGSITRGLIVGRFLTRNPVSPLPRKKSKVLECYDDDEDDDDVNRRDSDNTYEDILTIKKKPKRKMSSIGLSVLYFSYFRKLNFFKLFVIKTFPFIIYFF